MRRLLFIALLGCRAAAPSDEATVARGQTSLGPFKAALAAELSSALTRGPSEAIEVCAERAPALARAHSKERASGGPRSSCGAARTHRPRGFPR